MPWKHKDKAEPNEVMFRQIINTGYLTGTRAQIICALDERGRLWSGKFYPATGLCTDWKLSGNPMKTGGAL